ncbi:MAG: TauD/TfdA family dioxygenase [Actinomycetota bacterium]
MTTPDFAEHQRQPLERVVLDDGVVGLRWPDGVEFECLGLWLHEQSAGIDPITREGTLDPSQLPPFDVLDDAVAGPSGDLVCTWIDGSVTTVDAGWLHHVASGAHLPDASVGRLRRWTAVDAANAPIHDGGAILDDEAVLESWLRELCTAGVARLTGCPVDDDFLGHLARRLGPIRGSNFGDLFTVEAVVDPDSTANTGLALGQHTDLPTRETPPGFQILHCVENTVSGGASRMADGLVVVDELRTRHPDAYDALTTLEWVFANRAPDGDHRWIGPVIDLGGPRSPLTLRAFYPVRLAPFMPIEEQPRAYDALRVFSEVAHDPRVMTSTPFGAGDLVAFDNRRILHGRDAFDPTAGRRRLRGCYLDHDDVYSRVRVLRRPGRTSIVHTPGGSTS